jgi:hypothetical protein
MRQCCTAPARERARMLSSLRIMGWVVSPSVPVGSSDVPPSRGRQDYRAQNKTQQSYIMTGEGSRK